MPGDPDPRPADPKALLTELLAAVREAATMPPPQLLDADQTAAYCGLSRSGMYRLLAADDFPIPVRPEGSLPRWKRSDLDKWIDRLKPGRGRPNRPESG